MQPGEHLWRVELSHGWSWRRMLEEVASHQD